MNKEGIIAHNDHAPLFAEARGDIAVSFEFFPPKTEGMAETLWRSIETLAPLNPRFVSERLVDDSAIVADLAYVQEQIKAWEAAGVTMMVVGARSVEQIKDLAPQV